MKKLLSGILCAAIAFSLTACTGVGGESGPKKLMLDMPIPENNAIAVAAKEFARLISEKTDGRYEIAIYPSNQLSGGDQTKAMEMLQGGIIDVQIHGYASYAAFEPKLAMLNMPWLFSSYEDVDEMIDSEKMDILNELLSNCGVVPLSFVEGGFRQLGNNIHPVSSVDDLQGLKIRVPGVSMFIDFFKNLGADPVVMNSSELYTALQQGAVDGKENEYYNYTSQKFAEVVKYMTEWNYSYDGYCLMMSEKAWNALSEDDKVIFAECAEEAAQTQREYVRADNEAAKEECINEYGVELIELTEEQLTDFKQASADFYESYKEIIGEDMYQAFEYTLD